MIPEYDLRRPAKILEKKIEIKTYIIQLNQSKNKKNYGTKFKLKNFLSGTSQISKIGHLVSILQCNKQRWIF